MAHPSPRPRGPAVTSLLLLPSGRPMVVAHRGASASVAEHTLSAYVAAIDSGADALECDVRLTRDGHLVCVHDRRVDRTSNGRGVVSTLELERLRQMDFASWRAELPATADELVGDPALPTPPDDDDAEPPDGVLALTELLDLVEATPRPLTLLIETKHPTRYAGMVEKELVRVLTQRGMAGPHPARPGRAVVMSFAKPALRRVRLLAPELPLVYLAERSLKPKRIDGSLPRGVGIAGPGLALLRRDPDYVRRVRERGNRVFVWTVDTPADIDFVLGLGVDAVISNRPGEVFAHLTRARPAR